MCVGQTAIPNFGWHSQLRGSSLSGLSECYSVAVKFKCQMVSIDSPALHQCNPFFPTCFCCQCQPNTVLTTTLTHLHPTFLCYRPWSCAPREWCYHHHPRLLFSHCVINSICTYFHAFTTINTCALTITSSLHAASHLLSQPSCPININQYQPTKAMKVWPLNTLVVCHDVTCCASHYTLFSFLLSKSHAILHQMITKTMEHSFLFHPLPSFTMSPTTHANDSAVSYVSTTLPSFIGTILVFIFLILMLLIIPTLIHNCHRGCDDEEDIYKPSIKFTIRNNNNDNNNEDLAESHAVISRSHPIDES